MKIINSVAKGILDELQEDKKRRVSAKIDSILEYIELNPKADPSIILAHLRDVGTHLNE